VSSAQALGGQAVGIGLGELRRFCGQRILGVGGLAVGFAFEHTAALVLGEYEQIEGGPTAQQPITYS
jgi:hypothetical protein